MRRMLLIAALLTVTAPTMGQDTDPEAAKEVGRLSQQINEALVKADTSFLEGVTADGFMVIGQTGRIGGKDSTFKGFGEGSLKFLAMDDSEVTVRLYGNAAIVNGRRVIKYKSRGQEWGGAVRFTRVLVRRGGRWQIASEQSTPIADQPSGSSE